MNKLLAGLKALREVCVALLMSVVCVLGAALGIMAIFGLYLVFLTLMPELGMVTVPPQ